MNGPVAELEEARARVAAFLEWLDPVLLDTGIVPIDELELRYAKAVDDLRLLEVGLRSVASDLRPRKR